MDHSISSVGDKKKVWGHSATFLGNDLPTFPLTFDEVCKLGNNEPFPKDEQRYQNMFLKEFEEHEVLPFTWTPQEQLYWEHHGTTNLLNYLVYRYKIKVLPQRRILTDFPIHILVEPASGCNLRCIMCFQSDASFRTKEYMGFMTISLFKEIVDQAAAGGAGALSIGSRGEPMMNRDLPEMLDYANRAGKFFDLKINTNAHFLDENMAHGILKANVNVLVISIDSDNSADYREIRVRGDFDRVVGNLRKFLEIKNEHYPNSNIEVRAAGVKVNSTQNDDSFSKFWSQYCDTVAFVDCQPRWDTYNNEVSSNNENPCGFLWERMYVWWDGTTNPCDEDYKSRLSPGNLKNNTIKKIWLGEKFTDLRNAHLSQRRGTYIPCDRCGVR